MILCQLIRICVVLRNFDISAYVELKSLRILEEVSGIFHLPSTIMEAACGRLHYSGGAAIGWPPAVETTEVDGKLIPIPNEDTF